MTSFVVRSSRRTEAIEITDLVERACHQSGISEGLVLLFVPHTTAAVFVNERADPCVARDIMQVLSRLVPEDFPYSHQEGNAPSHVRATLLGASVTLPVRAGKLQLGTWQGIFLAEFDGPRERRVMVVPVEAPGRGP